MKMLDVGLIVGGALVVGLAAMLTSTPIKGGSINHMGGTISATEAAICQTYGRTAAHIMRKRQKGQSIADMKSAVAENRSDRLVVMLTDLVDRSFETPRYDDILHIESAAAEFGRDAEMQCQIDMLHESVSAPSR